jgi:hypothetical protein
MTQHVVERIVIGQVAGQVAVPLLGKCGDDPVLRQIVALTAAGLVQFENAGRLAGTYLLELIVFQWQKVGGTVESWRNYETSLGITRSHTKPPKSIIQPFLKWAGGGSSGRISKLAAAFDEWRKLGDDRPAPPIYKVFEPGSSDFGQWLTEKGGYTGVYRWTKEYAEPEYIITPPEEYEELEDVLPPGGFKDVCPYPRKPGYNALDDEWAQINHCNPNFSKAEKARED